MHWDLEPLVFTSKPVGAVPLSLQDAEQVVSCNLVASGKNYYSLLGMYFLRDLHALYDSLFLKFEQFNLHMGACLYISPCYPQPIMILLHSLDHFLKSENCDNKPYYYTNNKNGQHLGNILQQLIIGENIQNCR